MDDDPRIQVYRTSMDSFLSWMSLVASAIDRKLFMVADLQDIGYWVAKIESEIVLHPFIVAYGYKENIEKLIRWYRAKDSPYKDWVFPLNFSVGQVTGEQSSPSRQGAERPRKPKSR